MIALAPWFSALNHIHCKRWIPVHIKNMLELSKRHPKIYKEFQKGSFTGQKTSKRFSCIALDQVHEQENVKIKGVAGAMSIIEKALMQWMIGGPEASNILEDFEGIFIGKKMDTHGYHHDEGASNQLHFKNDVNKLVSTWEEKGNPFAEDNPHLLNIHTRTVAPDEVAECIFSLEDLGKKQYEEYIQAIFIAKTKSIWDKITTNKLKLFSNASNSPSSSGPLAITLLKKNSRLFVRLLLNAQGRSGNTGNFFSCEPFSYPPSLSTNGLLYLGTKSEIIKELLPHQQSSKDLSPSNIQVKIFDAPPTIQSLGIPSTVKTFQEYKFHFWSHIKKKTENMNRVDVVFDRYFDNSLKSCTRSKRGSSSVVAFQSNTPLPKNWH